MNILHVLNYGWPHIDGYTVRAAGLTSAQVAHLGLQVTVATSPYSAFAQARDEDFRLEGWGPGNTIRAAVYADDGAPAPPRSWERPAVGFSPVTHARFVNELTSICMREHIDVIHAHHPHYIGRAGLDAARQLSLPFVYEVRCFNGDYDLDRRHPYVRARGHWQNRQEYALAKQADAVVTIADGLADRLIRAGVPQQQVHVVRNSVNTELFRSRGAHKPTGTLQIGYATTFEKIENLDCLIEAAALAREILSPQGRSVHLTIAGTGRDWGRIDALIKAKGLDDLIRLPGFIAYSQMADFYKALDLFVIARGQAIVSQDTTPLKPLEAAACGIPILSTDIPAMTELLRDQPGARFAKPSAAALAGKIAEFAAAPWSGVFDLGARAWSKEVEKYSGVYDQARSIHEGQFGKSTKDHKAPKHAKPKTRSTLRDLKVGLQSTGALAAFGQHALRQHIVVCGMPRSGSTLLQTMVSGCIEGVETYEGEVDARDVIAPNGRLMVNHRARDILTKRPDDIFHIDAIRDAYAARGRSRVRFIFMLRDPRDVLTSVHNAYSERRGYYVSPERWRSIWHAMTRCAQAEDYLTVRYEHLVDDPDALQSTVRSWLDWPAARAFSQFHRHAGTRDSLTEGALGGLRPVTTSQVARWRSDAHFDRMCYLVETMPDLSSALIDMGYESDDSWASRYRKDRVTS